MDLDKLLITFVMALNNYVFVILKILNIHMHTMVTTKYIHILFRNYNCFILGLVTTGSVNVMISLHRPMHLQDNAIRTAVLQWPQP